MASFLVDIRKKPRLGWLLAILVLLATLAWVKRSDAAGGPIRFDEIRPDRVPADAQQVIVVHADQAKDTSVTLQSFERRNGTWQSVHGPMGAHVGRSGIAVSRVEGDGTTPAGTFSITEAFGIKTYDAAKLPYRTVGPYDWWVSDSNAPDYYNTFQTTTPQEGNNPRNWSGSRGEHLINFGTAYNYAAVINYNRPPTVAKPVPGLGSAIFLHVDTGKPTSGCVSIGEDAMRSVLGWLDPLKHPAILIGTDRDLLLADGAGPVIGTDPVGFDVVTPYRVLDTRTGRGRADQATTALGPEQAIDVQVVPTIGSPVADGVPNTATAVALNVTITGQSADTFLTVFPTPDSAVNPPLVSNVNALPGEDRANLVVVGTQTGSGRIRIFNKHGTAHVVVDVVGYASPAGTGRVQVVAPYRIVDTRDGTGAPTTDPLGADSDLLAAVPFAPANATAVIATVTVVDPTAGTWLSAFGGGGAAWPGTSTVNTRANETSANLAIMPLDPATRTVKVHNRFGKSHVLVDVAGFVVPAGDRYVPARTPQRVLDTRIGLGVRGRIAADEAINLKIPGLPPEATAVAVTVTGVEATVDTHLTVQAAGGTTNSVSNVNLRGGSTRANLVIVPVSKDGVITIGNKNGSIHLVADVSGWFQP